MFEKKLGVVEDGTKTEAPVPSWKINDFLGFAGFSWFGVDFRPPGSKKVKPKDSICKNRPGSAEFELSKVSENCGGLQWQCQGPSNISGSTGFGGRCSPGTIASSKSARRFMHFRKMHFSKILQIFGGLVLGCIKTKFCK